VEGEDRDRNRDRDMYYYNLGMKCLEQEDYERSLAYFEQSLSICSHYKTCSRIAQVLKVLGREEEAESYIVRAYEENQKSDKAALVYAELLLKNGQTELTRTILEKLLSRNPTYGPAQRLMKQMDLRTRFDD